MKNKLTKNAMINCLASEYVYNMDHQELLDYAIECMAKELLSLKLKELKEQYTTTFDLEKIDD